MRVMKSENFQVVKIETEDAWKNMRLRMAPPFCFHMKGKPLVNMWNSRVQEGIDHAFMWVTKA